MVFTILKIRAIYMYITSLDKKKIHCASYRPPIIQHMVNKWFSKSFICYRTINQTQISRKKSNFIADRILNSSTKPLRT